MRRLSNRGGWSQELPVALGGGIHVVSDTDGLFEETLHTAEVHAAVHKVLHSAAGILHCVDGSLALLLPPLHVCLWATGGLLAVGAAISILPAL